MCKAKPDIRSFSKEQLKDFFITQGFSSFRAHQVYQWIWQKSADDFHKMTNLSKHLRELLAHHFQLSLAKISQTQHSIDGTLKNAVTLPDGLVVESVLIPTPTRTTACVSSQVGCSLDCKFCATSLLKRMRNLTAGEIFDQVVLTNEQSIKYYQKPLSNIVFMGMGEPLLNYKNVLRAIEMITTDEGIHMSAKRITLSTSGIPRMIQKMADDNVRFHLAVSLHSAIDKVRNEIMPFSKNFPLKDLRESLQYWYAKTKRKITYEYVVWKGINDRQKDIDALVKFCRYVPSKVNLISYNAIGTKTFQQADETAINNYIYFLQLAGIVVNVRRSRGQDIDAACGQLANKTTSF